MSVGTLRPGTRFGAYEVVGLLGSGAFGTVYEAMRHPLRKRVALKVLHGEMVERPEAVARFLREAETTAQLQHPHIIDVQDMGSFEGVPYMAMELLVGETLEDRVEREGRLSVETAVDLMLPVLSAVAAMHDRGLVHRDLKPANVFVTQGPHGDHPVLLDLGIVKLQQHDSALTRTASLLGTPSYMAPEQVREARDIDARADVWSLGVMLYACVTGAAPFVGESMFETFDQIMHGPIVPPGARVGGVPTAFDAVVLRAMKREASARTATVRDLAVALLPFASDAARSRWSRDFQRVAPPRVSPPRVEPRREPEPTLVEESVAAPKSLLRQRALLGGLTVALVTLVAALVVRDARDVSRPVVLSTPAPRTDSRRAPDAVAPVERDEASGAAVDAPASEADSSREPPHRRRTPASRGTRDNGVIGNY